MQYTLGGVVFALVTRYPMKRMEWMGHYGRKAGLHTLGKLPPPTNAAELETVLADIVGKAYDARVVCELLAGGLERVGERWSEAQAIETVKHLQDVEEGEAYAALAAVLYDFIKSEPDLLRSTLLYSSPLAAPGTEASSPMPSAADPSRSPPATTIASGPPSPGG